MRSRRRRCTAPRAPLRGPSGHPEPPYVLHDRGADEKVLEHCKREKGPEGDARKADISVDDIERAKRILAKHDPRRARAGTLRTVVLSQHDVDLVLNYAASQLRRGSTRVALRPGSATVQASLEMPGSPFGAWLNVDAALREIVRRTGRDSDDYLAKLQAAKRYQRDVY